MNHQPMSPLAQQIFDQACALNRGIAATVKQADIYTLHRVAARLRSKADEAMQHADAQAPASDERLMALSVVEGLQTAEQIVLEMARVAL